MDAKRGLLRVFVRMPRFKRFPSYLIIVASFRQSAYL